MTAPAVGQLWERKEDGVLVAIRERPAQLGYSSHLYAQNLRTGRHFDVSEKTLANRYEHVGYDRSEPASMREGTSDDRD